MSPALLLIIGGVVFAQWFFSWTRRRQAEGKSQLFSLDVLKTGAERATTWCMATMLFVGTAANFLIPLFLQIVQGRSSFATSIAVIPYTLSIFLASTFVANLYTRMHPSKIARIGFVIVAAGLTLLAFTIRNDWSQALVVIGLITLGLGQGSIVALVFNTLLSSAPKELSGDVGVAWPRAQHLGQRGHRGGQCVRRRGARRDHHRPARAEPGHPAGAEQQVNLDQVNFIADPDLKTVLSRTTATPAQVDEAVQINTEARVRALRTSLLVLAGLALLAIVPAGRMPGGPNHPDTAGSRAKGAATTP